MLSTPTEAADSDADEAAAACVVSTRLGGRLLTSRTSLPSTDRRHGGRVQRLWEAVECGANDAATTGAAVAAAATAAAVSTHRRVVAITCTGDATAGRGGDAVDTGRRH